MDIIRIQLDHSSVLLGLDLREGSQMRVKHIRGPAIEPGLLMASLLVHREFAEEVEAYSERVRKYPFRLSADEDGHYLHIQEQCSEESYVEVLAAQFLLNEMAWDFGSKFYGVWEGYVGDFVELMRHWDYQDVEAALQGFGYQDFIVQEGPVKPRTVSVLDLLEGEPGQDSAKQFVWTGEMPEPVGEVEEDEEGPEDDEEEADHRCLEYAEYSPYPDDPEDIEDKD